MHRVEWNDHQFTAWLRYKDPDWKANHVGISTQYIAKDKIVAVAIFNNKTASREIYVEE